VAKVGHFPFAGHPSVAAPVRISRWLHEAMAAKSRPRRRGLHPANNVGAFPKRNCASASGAQQRLLHRGIDDREHALPPRIVGRELDSRALVAVNARAVLLAMFGLAAQTYGRLGAVRAAPRGHQLWVEARLGAEPQQDIGQNAITGGGKTTPLRTRRNR